MPFVNNFISAAPLVYTPAAVVLKSVWILMAPHEHDEDDDLQPDRLFSLSEANQMIPQLVEHLTAIKRGKAVLVHTKDEIKKASRNAQFGGGSFAAPHYITALECINDRLQKIHEMGVLVKDVEMGLCDFPHMLDGHIVYLCWKLGETDVQWWHDIHSGYADRQPLNS